MVVLSQFIVNDRAVLPINHEDGLLDLDAFDFIREDRERIEAELLQVTEALWMNNSRIKIGGKLKSLSFNEEGFFEFRKQHKTPDRRLGRGHKQAMVATKPPVGRFVLLSKLEETLFIKGQAFELSANLYPGVVHPQGFRYLKQFRLDPFPVFTYEIEGIEIEKSVFMIYGENSTVIHYELRKNNHPESPKKLWLELRPLIAFRDYHSTTH